MLRQDNPLHKVQMAQVGWLVSCVITIVWLIGTHSTGKIWLLPLGLLAVGFGGHLIYFRDRLSDVFSRQRAQAGLETASTSPTMMSALGVGFLAVGATCILLGLLTIMNVL